MELWDIYDINRSKTGKTAVRGDSALPEGDYHMAVHVCIIDSDGRMLIQQRQPFKKGWSNLWDVTVGGSALAGETSADAAMRETNEEIGLRIELNGIRPRFSVNFEDGFDDWYIIRSAPDISSLTLQYEEVQAVKWASCDEILSLIDSGEFIPYYKSFINYIFDIKDHLGSKQEQR